MGKFSESLIVEDYFIQKLEEKGWKFIHPDELERESYQEPLLIPNLVRAFIRVNKGLNIGDEEINKVVNELKLTGTGIEGAKRILNFYRFGVPIKFEKEKVVRYVQIFDFKNIENNEFIITRQVYYQGRDRIRTDITLYVNGLSLVDIECKNPTNISESWFNAYKQIKDYEKNVPELYKYVQIGVAAESTAKYFPIVPWQEEVKTHEWKVEERDSIDSTVEMLSRETLLDIIRNFLFYRVESGEATKVITRYMQYRAANKIVNRVKGSIESKSQGVGEPKNKGLIWHWQGSGKTLTMIFAAHKLFYMAQLENPTIFLIVDRIELEDQLYREFNALDIIKPETINSVSELKEILRYDDYRGKRGLFITLIHKFRPEELKKLQGELKKVPQSRETILTRRNVIAFIDEGHRTQYGNLAGQRKSILGNAFSFAFTGTPISKRGRNTYCEFSYLPEEPYLDKYFITDSIRDGFTVKIVYQPKLEKEVHLKKEQLETFLKSGLEELPEEIKGRVEEKVKQKLNLIKLRLEDPSRIKVIAEDIAQHFKNNVDGKFKALVVAGSRTACDLYEEELNKYFPKEYIEVQRTYRKMEEPETLLRVAETRVQYGGRDIDDIRKDIREKFKEEDLPKILIVTEMLLTGFDAPVLQVMYLDKLLKEHRLLQAIARTNRPFKDLKEGGIVIDYVGILKEFKRAFELYREEDIKGAVYDFDQIREEFAQLLEELLELLKKVPKNYAREALLKSIEVLTGEEKKEKAFQEKYKSLRKTFELLGPDEIKLEYLKDYKWLSAIYAYYMKMVIQKPAYEDHVQRFYDKTVKFVHQTLEIEKLEQNLPPMDVDEEYLQALEEKVKNKKEKAANILFTLNRLVLVERCRNPVYESLVEKVERLLEMWREQTKDYERIYTEGVKAVKEINQLFARQKSINFSDLEYSILIALERKFNQQEDFAKEVKELSQRLKKHMFFDWSHQTTVKKEVEREIRRFARGIKGKYNLSLEEMNTLHDKLFENVKSYGTAQHSL